MDYDVVIATRNRLDALRMSLPLLGQQSKLPKKLIVVDSSDDSSIASRVISEHSLPKEIEVALIRSDRANSSHQRNLGIDHVTSPITMLPDDDSLWFSTTAEEVMRVYEADADGDIGGVSCTPVSISPIAKQGLTYGVNGKLVLKKRFDVVRNAVEDMFFESPFRHFARNCAAFSTPPAWTTKQNLPSLELVTGFRMSFRTDLVRTYLFDTILGYKSGYCLFEDADMSLRVLANGKSLIAAPAAKVFHHTFPGKRTNGYDYGFSHIANYAYICCKNMTRTPSLKKELDRYLRFRLTLYSLRRDSYGRDVHRGALTAWNMRQELWNAPAESLSKVFMHICDKSKEHAAISLAS